MLDLGNDWTAPVAGSGHTITGDGFAANNGDPTRGRTSWPTKASRWRWDGSDPDLTALVNRR